MAYFCSYRYPLKFNGHTKTFVTTHAVMVSGKVLLIVIDGYDESDYVTVTKCVPMVATLEV